MRHHERSAERAATLVPGLIALALGEAVERLDRVLLDELVEIDGEHH